MLAVGYIFNERAKIHEGNLKNLRVSHNNLINDYNSLSGDFSALVVKHNKLVEDWNEQLSYTDKADQEIAALTKRRNSLMHDKEFLSGQIDKGNAFIKDIKAKYNDQTKELELTKQKLAVSEARQSSGEANHKEAITAANVMIKNLTKENNANSMGLTVATGEATLHRQVSEQRYFAMQVLQETMKRIPSEEKVNALANAVERNPNYHKGLIAKQLTNDQKEDIDRILREICFTGYKTAVQDRQDYRTARVLVVEDLKVEAVYLEEALVIRKGLVDECDAKGVPWDDVPTIWELADVIQRKAEEKQIGIETTEEEEVHSPGM